MPKFRIILMDYRFDFYKDTNNETEDLFENIIINNNLKKSPKLINSLK